MILLPNGQEVSINVNEIRNRSGERAKVRIGITAPREIPVYRREVLEEIRAKRRTAAEGTA